MSKEFKTLLEHDYGYRSEALWKNEQSGETRVNLFIGFVTLAERRGKVDARRFGGLAHTVGVINALLCAGIAFVIILLLGMPFRRPDVVTYLSAGFAALLASGYVFYWQIQYADDEEERAKNKFRSDLGLPTHAGGVVYELRDGIPYYLMISPKDRTDKSDRKGEWVLPKGHIKDGETPGETAEEHGEAALREVREETGVVARLAGLLGRVKFNKQGEDQDAKFYLMEKMYEVASEPGENRLPQWLPIEQAVGALTYAESRYLIREAHKRLQSNPKPKAGGAQTQFSS